MPERTATTIDAETVRREHFERLLDHLEAEGPDGSVPGSTSVPVRYAVLTESDRGHGRFLTYAADMDRIQEVAAANIHEGWQPVAYFDLDDLGDDLEFEEGDRVEYEGHVYYVTHANFDVFDGEAYQKLWLDEKPDVFLDAQHAEVDMNYVTLVEHFEGFEDTRLPRRYDVAGVNLAVAFNTIPTEH